MAEIDTKAEAESLFWLAERVFNMWPIYADHTNYSELLRALVVRAAFTLYLDAVATKNSLGPAVLDRMYGAGMICDYKLTIGDLLSGKEG